MGSHGVPMGSYGGPVPDGIFGPMGPLDPGRPPWAQTTTLGVPIYVYLNIYQFIRALYLYKYINLNINLYIYI